MSEIVRFWNGEALTGSPVNKDITWKKIQSRALVDIRTNAAADADISVVITCYMVVDHNAVGGLAAPHYVRTLSLAEMNNVIAITPPFPMKLMRITAYTPTTATFYAATFDLYAMDNLGV